MFGSLSGRYGPYNHPKSLRKFDKECCVCRVLLPKLINVQRVYARSHTHAHARERSGRTPIILTTSGNRRNLSLFEHSAHRESLCSGTWSSYGPCVIRMHIIIIVLCQYLFERPARPHHFSDSDVVIFFEVIIRCTHNHRAMADLLNNKK